MKLVRVKMYSSPSLPNCHVPLMTGWLPVGRRFFSQDCQVDDAILPDAEALRDSSVAGPTLSGALCSGASSTGFLPCRETVD